MTQHNYKIKMGRLVNAGLIAPGTINHVNIAHDGWCDALKTPPGFCNCDPDLSLNGKPLIFKPVDKSGDSGAIYTIS